MYNFFYIIFHLFYYRYCTNFLKGNDCINNECLYIHYLADECDIIQRVYILIKINFFFNLL